MAGSSYTLKFTAVADLAKVEAQINALRAKAEKPIVIPTTTTGGGGGIPGKAPGVGVEKQTKQLHGMAKALSAVGSAAKQMMAYTAAGFISAAAIGTIGKAVENISNLDKALTEFKKVSNISDTGLESFIAQAGELGQVVARTSTEMIEAATEFRKSNFGDVESLQLAQTAALFQNVADSEVSAGDASSFLISQMKAFNISAQDAIHIVDAVNEVSNNYAVSSTDLSMALTKTASAMAVQGNSFEQTLGLYTGGIEVMTHQALTFGACKIL